MWLIIGNRKRIDVNMININSEILIICVQPPFDRIYT